MKEKNESNITSLGITSFILGIISLTLILSQLVFATVIGLSAVLLGFLSLVIDKRKQPNKILPVIGLISGLISPIFFLIIIF